MAPTEKLHNNLLAYKLTGPDSAYNDPQTPVNAVQNLEKIVSQVIGVLTLVAAIYFGIQIILAGFAFISAEGDKNKMEVARKRLTEGVLGLVLVVVAVGFAALVAKLAGITGGPAGIFDLQGSKIWAPGP